MREDIKRGVYVEGLAEETVEGSDEAVAAMLRGALNRRVGSTAMNRESSRSHSVFTVTIEAKEADSTDLQRSRHARFSLVDLAGSERQRDTDASGAQLKEVRGDCVGVVYIASAVTPGGLLLHRRATSTSP